MGIEIPAAQCGVRSSTTRPSLTGGSTRTPTWAMPSAFFWPMSVPSALRAPAPVNQGVDVVEFASLACPGARQLGQ